MADGKMLDSEKYPKGKSRLWTDIDLEKDGKQCGYIRMNSSRHEHALSWIGIPMVSIKNGPGPRILLLGGVHGDEYEGQVMLMKLLRQLKAEDVKGQLIFLPAANAPAALAGRRTSPLDDGNLNRLFPGDPNGTPTQEIAYYITYELMSRVEYVFDFHSGGAAADHVPTAHVYYHPDKEKWAKLKHFLEVFGMPDSMVLHGLMGNDQRLIGVSEKTGVLRFASELGGGSRVSIDALRPAEEGLARLLYDVGALRKPLTDKPPKPIHLMSRLPNRQYVYAMSAGVFEPYAKLGEDIKAGQEAGAIHYPDTPWREPEIVIFKDSGNVHAIRARAQTELGDMLYIICVPWVTPQ